MEDILRKLVQFHTTDDDRQAMHQALDFIADYLAKRGMHIARFESGGYESLVATVAPDHKTPKVMLAAHLDVVPADEAMFDMREQDGKLYGRGVLDMKYAIAAYMHFVDKVQDRLEDYDIGIMITTDEETGGTNGTQKLVEEGYLPEVCLIPDGGDNWQIQLHAKGFLYLKLQCHGTSVHSSRPWGGDSAILPLLKALSEVSALFENKEGDATTASIGVINAGGAVNQVPGYAEALMDVRVVSDADKAPVLEQIGSICKKHGVELTLVLDAAVAEFSLDDPYIAPFVSAITEVTGVRVTGSRTLGSNDARYFAAKGVPCISLYPAGGNHHGPEEWLEKRALLQFYEILQRYLDEVANMKVEKPSQSEALAIL